jgi:hypothetical protein
MARDPETGKVEPDPKFFTGKETISILSYHSGFVAYLPEVTSGLCGGDLRELAIALIFAADRVDSLNRSYEKGEIKDASQIAEHIPVKALS